MKTLISTLLALFVGFVESNAQPNFVRITNSVLTAELVTGSGAAWADYDGDGLLDLAQANFDGPNLLFHNNGDGTFMKVTTNGVAIAGPESYGVSWGDFDNDGRPDLFFGNGYVSGRPNLLFHNQTLTSEGFVRVMEGPGATNLTLSSVGCSWADYDRDGFLDLFVANSGKPSELWHNKGDGSFERVLAGAIVTNIADSIAAAWADYDNDGWPDLFVANGLGAGSNQKNFLYHNNRDGTFTQIKTGAIVNDLDQFIGAAWGDYDNDGFLDLFTTGGGLGHHNYLYHNNGDGTFTSITTGPIVNDRGTFIAAAWADYDNDGWLDLFVGNRTLGQGNFLYHNNGGGTFTKVITGPIVEDRDLNGACAWGDYDNDGFSDLFVSGQDYRAPNSGQSRLYHNEGTTNNWLKIIPHATRSNASAVGAKVRVTAIINGKTVTQLREINTGDGLAGNSQEALFGLGDTNAAASVSIEWPAGTVQVMTNVPAQQFLTVIEPAALKALAILPNGSFQFSLTGGIGLHYFLETSSDLGNWTFWTGVTCTNRTMTLTDTNVSTSSKRFYRAVKR